jgi:hypothetical protein
VIGARPDKRRFEAWIVGFLALFAAGRMLLLAATFPFFNNVDEIRHYDVVYKYAQGRLPRPDELRFDPSVMRNALLWSSPEYLRSRFSEEGAQVPPPPGGDPRVLRSPVFRRQWSEYSRLHNTAVHPPTYYALAGLWWRLGHAAGIREPSLVYWTRGLGALFAAGLVLVARGLLLRTHGDDPLMHVGVPMLLAVFPQDAWFSVSNDALSPLAFGAAFALLCRVRAGPSPGFRQVALAGLLVGLTFLVKYTNVGVLVVALWAWGGRWWDALGGERASRPRWSEEWRRATVFCAAAAVLVLPWLARNVVVFGEVMATSIPLESAGWFRKPLASFLPHPVFGFEGARRFFEMLATTFWRGEFVWFSERLRVVWADWAYQISSAVLLALAALGLLRRGASGSRRVEGLALVAVLVGVATLVGATLAYEFPVVGVPTRAEPYVGLGRYIGGVLLPFSILYVKGIRMLAGRLPERMRNPGAWALLLAIAAVALVSEALLGAGVFQSQYNWFHLPT